MSESKYKSDEMREGYDFSQSVRGKHCRAYRAGHIVTVTMNKVVDEIEYEMDGFSQEAAGQTLRRTEW